MTDTFRSSLVALFKVLLPLVALAILSTLFLVARTIDPQGAIPLAEVDIADRVREPRLTAATWAGMTEDGAALEVTAGTARPAVAGGRGASAESMRAVLEAPDGGRTEITAAQGEIDPEGAVLSLAGGVRVTTAAGWEVTTEALAARLDRTELAAPGTVSVAGPFGTLAAGAMRLTAAADRPEAHVLLFTGGVRLVYRPRDATPSAD